MSVPVAVIHYPIPDSQGSGIKTNLVFEIRYETFDNQQTFKMKMLNRLLREL